MQVEYSTPKVTIDLAEYQELKSRLEQLEVGDSAKKIDTLKEVIRRMSELFITHVATTHDGPRIFALLQDALLSKELPCKVQIVNQPNLRQGFTVEFVN